MNFFSSLDIIFYYSQNNPMRWVLLSILQTRKVKLRGSFNLLKVTQLTGMDAVSPDLLFPLHNVTVDNSVRSPLRKRGSERLKNPNTFVDLTYCR